MGVRFFKMLLGGACWNPKDGLATAASARVTAGQPGELYQNLTKSN